MKKVVVLEFLFLGDKERIETNLITNIPSKLYTLINFIIRVNVMIRVKLDT